MDTQLFLLLLFFLLFIITISFVPLIFKLVKMIGSVSTLINTANDGVKPLLSEITDTVKNANRIVGSVHDILEGIKELSSSFKEMGGAIKKLGLSLRDADQYVSNIKNQATGLTSAIKTTVAILKKGILKKGGNQDE